MYSVLVDGLCKDGRLKDAQKVFKDLLIKGYNLNIVTYNVMIIGFAVKNEDKGCKP